MALSLDAWLGPFVEEEVARALKVVTSEPDAGAGTTMKREDDERKGRSHVSNYSDNGTRLKVEVMLRNPRLVWVADAAPHYRVADLSTSMYATLDPLVKADVGLAGGSIAASVRRSYGHLVYIHRFDLLVAVFAPKSQRVTMAIQACSVQKRLYPVPPRLQELDERRVMQDLLSGLETLRYDMMNSSSSCLTGSGGKGTGEEEQDDEGDVVEIEPAQFSASQRSPRIPKAAARGHVDEPSSVTNARKPARPPHDDRHGVNMQPPRLPYPPRQTQDSTAGNKQTESGSLTEDNIDSAQGRLLDILRMRNSPSKGKQPSKRAPLVSNGGYGGNTQSSIGMATQVPHVHQARNRRQTSPEVRLLFKSPTQAYLTTTKSLSSQITRVSKPLEESVDISAHAARDKPVAKSIPRAGQSDDTFSELVSLPNYSEHVDQQDMDHSHMDLEPMPPPLAEKEEVLPRRQLNRLPPPLWTKYAQRPLPKEYKAQRGRSGGWVHQSGQCPVILFGEVTHEVKEQVEPSADKNDEHGGKADEKSDGHEGKLDDENDENDENSEGEEEPDASQLLPWGSSPVREPATQHSYNPPPDSRQQDPRSSPPAKQPAPRAFVRSLPAMDFTSSAEEPPPVMSQPVGEPAMAEQQVNSSEVPNVGLPSTAETSTSIPDSASSSVHIEVFKTSSMEQSRHSGGAGSDVQSPEMPSVHPQDTAKEPTVKDAEPSQPVSQDPLRAHQKRKMQWYKEEVKNARQKLAATPEKSSRAASDELTTEDKLTALLEVFKAQYPGNKLGLKSFGKLCLGLHSEQAKNKVPETCWDKYILKQTAYSAYAKELLDDGEYPMPYHQYWHEVVDEEHKAPVEDPVLTRQALEEVYGVAQDEEARKQDVVTDGKPEQENIGQNEAFGAAQLEPVGEQDVRLEEEDQPMDEDSQHDEVHAAAARSEKNREQDVGLGEKPKQEASRQETDQAAHDTSPHVQAVHIAPHHPPVPQPPRELRSVESPERASTPAQARNASVSRSGESTPLRTGSSLSRTSNRHAHPRMTPRPEAGNTPSSVQSDPARDRTHTRAPSGTLATRPSPAIRTEPCAVREHDSRSRASSRSRHPSRLSNEIGRSRTSSSSARTPARAAESFTPGSRTHARPRDRRGLRHAAAPAPPKRDPIFNDPSASANWSSPLPAAGASAPATRPSTTSVAGNGHVIWRAGTGQVTARESATPARQKPSGANRGRGGPTPTSAPRAPIHTGLPGQQSARNAGLPPRPAITLPPAVYDDDGRTPPSGARGGIPGSGSGSTSRAQERREQAVEENERKVETGPERASRSVSGRDGARNHDATKTDGTRMKTTDGMKPKKMERRLLRQRLQELEDVGNEQRQGRYYVAEFMQRWMSVGRRERVEGANAFYEPERT